MKRALRITGIVLGTLVLAAGLAIGGYAYNNMTYYKRGRDQIAKNGFTEHQVQINGSSYNYAVGPDNGPALLLIHGQEVDWMNYATVLTELRKDFQIYAVDVLGHGASDWDPAKYNLVAIGTDLRDFMDEVIGEPAIVSGHSSGGMLATWLAANAPDQVRGAILEDPPFFTTQLPRAHETWNWQDTASTCHAFLASDEDDYVAYYLQHSKLWEFFGDGAEDFQGSALDYRAKHPGEPVKLWIMPPGMNEVFRGLNSYDPRFGETFYTGSWNDGWDEQATMAAIEIPTVYIHTKVDYSDDGTLLAAASDEEAARATELIPGVEFHQVDSGHGFHWEKPRQYVRIVRDFADRIGA